MTNLIDPTKQKKIEGFDPNVDNIIKKPVVGNLGKWGWYSTFILLLPIIFHIKMKNDLFYLQTEINELSSGIDVQLKKRKDTLIKLLDSTKGYMKYEKKLFQDITKLRKMNVLKVGKEKLNNTTESIFSKLIAVSENYPDLKTNQNILNLMEQVSYLESEISASRRLYNSSVQKFNSKLFIWPYSVVSSSLNLNTFPYFVASQEDKKDIKIDFSI